METGRNVNPSWLKDCIFYQVYPQSFYDSNGDGVGDLPGVIEKLDYIRSLGAGAIWLAPCFASPMHDAGYDVADYYRVDQRYGTNADLYRLFREAHRRGLRVCLDLVAGHTSIEHPWFKLSQSRKQPNKYSDWYIWTKRVWDVGDGSARFINGYSQRNGNFAINFFWSQPALNYGYARINPKTDWQQPIDAPGPKAVRAEMERIMRFWLERGCDGFRVDMAKSLIKNDPKRKAVVALWREVRAWMRRDYPEAAMISEWSHPTQAIRAGFDIDFMLHWGVPGYPSLFFNEWSPYPGGRCFFDRHGEGTISTFLEEYLSHYRKTRGKGYVALQSSSHDINRPNTRRSLDELKVIYAFLLTWPGVPFIYYGDEIGMRYIENMPSKEGGYVRTGSRTPMQWTGGHNAGFSSAPARQLYLPIDRHRDRPTVTAQEGDANSLLNYIRRLIALRRRHRALQADGFMVPLYARPFTYPFVYLRRLRNDRFVVAINPSDKPVEASFALKDLRRPEPIVADGAELKPTSRGGRLGMRGISSGIWRV